jgi:hypothetical protein
MTNRIAEHQGQANVQEVRMNVVLFKESPGEGEKEIWVAQGLELDIVCQHEDVQELMKVFRRTVMGYVCLASHTKSEPFANLKRAPQEYWQKYKEGFELREVFSLASPDNGTPSGLPAGRIPTEATARVY